MPFTLLMAHGALATAKTAVASAHRSQQTVQGLKPLKLGKPAVLARRIAQKGKRDLRVFAGAEDEVPDKPFEMAKSIDSAGAGKSFTSPGWLTELGRLWGGKSNVPVADAKPDDIKDLLGGALFVALFKWYRESGPVYLLPTGPISSFMVVSEPQAAKHVLRNYGTYEKGLVREISEFLFGTGFAVADGENWRVRRRAVLPSLHKSYLEKMVDLVFAACSIHMCNKLEESAKDGKPVDMEAKFSQLTLDIIGKAVFNYDFDALNNESPVIQAVYTALKETEQRATDVLPLWKFPILAPLIPRQRKAVEAVRTIRETTEMLIAKCKKMVDEEERQQGSLGFGEEYVNEADPSVLRFLIASREEVSSSQLRDDLLSMLVAGHETTASVLTWTLYLLLKNPDKLALINKELNEVMGDRETVVFADYPRLRYVMRCINESMRLYPHPPVLLRRALVPDTLPGNFEVPAGQDVMISVYNIHHSPEVWEDPEAFIPERFGPLEGPVPNEVNTDFKYIPFSGGQRKCVGDQFALMEAVVALATALKRFEFTLVPNQQINMTTGATIHTTSGLFMTLKRREKAAASGAKVVAGAAS